MLCKRMIPCLDVHGGRVVKGVRFVDLRDAGDPVEAALAYDAQGADELVFLDITASSDQRDTIVEVVRRTAEEVFIPFTIGGTVKFHTTSPETGSRRLSEPLVVEIATSEPVKSGRITAPSPCRGSRGRSRR